MTGLIISVQSTVRAVSLIIFVPIRLAAGPYVHMIDLLGSLSRTEILFFRDHADPRNRALLGISGRWFWFRADKVCVCTYFCVILKAVAWVCVRFHHSNTEIVVFAGHMTPEWEKNGSAYRSTWKIRQLMSPRLFRPSNMSRS